MGGPLSLRGFENCGVGARSYSQGGVAPVNTDSLGGDSRASLLAMLSVPVPYQGMAAAGARAFAFFNAGSIGPDNYFNKGQSNSVPFFGYLRASVGGGMSMSFNNQIRLETTYSIPLVKARQDSVRGFQIGVGFTIN